MYMYVSIEYTCKGFPGPGDTAPMSENLFFEVFGSESYSNDVRTHHVNLAFEKFKSRYGKSYSDEKEEAMRLNNFHHNFR